MRLCALVLVVSSGCGDVRPLANDPPRLLSVNGVEVGQDGEPVELEPVVYGEVYPLVLEVVDPEGDGFTVWFPEAPPGLEFHPDDTEGTLTIPEDDIFAHDTLRIILWDDHPREPRPSSWMARFGPPFGEADGVR